jgi:hypothetical protein
VNTAKGDVSDLGFVTSYVSSEFNFFVWLLLQTTQQDFSGHVTHSNQRPLQTGRRANVFGPISGHELFDNVDVKTLPVSQINVGRVSLCRYVFPFYNLVDHAIDTVESKFPINGAPHVRLTGR